jgi:hypothetical protein
MLERQDRKVDGWDEPETRPFLKAIYAFGHQFAVMGFQDIRMVKTEAALRPEVNGSDSGAFDVCKTPGLERKLARGSRPHFHGRGGFRLWSSKLQVCMPLLARRGAVRKHPRLDIGSSEDPLVPAVDLRPRNGSEVQREQLPSERPSGSPCGLMVSGHEEVLIEARNVGLGDPAGSG